MRHRLRAALGAAAAALAVAAGPFAASPASALPPGPGPTHHGPYGGYGLWLGTCSHQPAGGPYVGGEISTHWDQYRGTAAVYELEINAAFSGTTTPRQPVLGKTFTWPFYVTGMPSQHYPPLKVGGRHQDGPLYLKFRKPWQHAVITVEFYWFNRQHQLLWKSPQPLYWRC